MTIISQRTDTVTLEKATGELIRDLSAKVRQDYISLYSGKHIVDTGDKLHRLLPNGGKETYEVVDAFFYERTTHTPRRYRIKFRKLAIEAEKESEMRIPEHLISQLGEIIIGDNPTIEFPRLTLEKIVDLTNSFSKIKHKFPEDVTLKIVGTDFINVAPKKNRRTYIKERIYEINGTSGMQRLVEKICNPSYFVVYGLESKYSESIVRFANFLENDGIKIVLPEGIKNPVLTENPQQSGLVEDFLKLKFENVSIEGVELNTSLTEVLDYRFKEIEICLNSGAPLAAIFLIGSLLEGLLLGVAKENIKEFNQATGSPKDKDGKVKKFSFWTLSNFIDVASELKLLNTDVHKFSHYLRDFRNYIHPSEQLSSAFQPDRHTAAICFQVLNAAISQLKINKIQKKYSIEEN